MSEKLQRLGILLITLLFIGTTIGTVGYTIYINSKNSDKTSEQQALEDAINKSQEEEIVPLDCKTDPSLAYTPTPPMQDKPLPNYTAQSNIPELTCVDIKVGDGGEVKGGATVTAHYTGAVAATGKVFQSSHDSGSPVAFSLSGVIKGWSQGVPGMKVGGIRRIYIPSDLAYGANPPSGSGIPTDADLVFDVEITKIGE